MSIRNNTLPFYLPVTSGRRLSLPQSPLPLQLSGHVLALGRDP
jgi:hypothetical protein